MIQSMSHHIKQNANTHFELVNLTPFDCENNFCLSPIATEFIFHKAPLYTTADIAL